MTERGDFRFTVKESANGTPWIAAEPSGPPRFRAKTRTNYEEAKTVASFLNTHIAAIIHTEI
jgi:hypothetical protein